MECLSPAAMSTTQFSDLRLREHHGKEERKIVRAKGQGVYHDSVSSRHKEAAPRNFRNMVA